MAEEDNEDLQKNNFCRFCEKNIECNKIRDHCHLTGKYRGPAHSRGDNNVTQDKSNFIQFIFLIFSIYDCHMSF